MPFKIPNKTGDAVKKRHVFSDRLENVQTITPWNVDLFIDIHFFEKRCIVDKKDVKKAAKSYIF